MSNTTDNIDVLKIADAIEMLNTYVNEPSIKPLISILDALKEDLHNESLLAQLTDAWRNLGVYQGTVLTYVPYFYTLIADDIFGDDLKETD
jgi:hypothetical protein